MHERQTSVLVGERLPELVCGPLTRAKLALYAGASGDHVPLHIDTDAAKVAGFDDVFGHGMLSMAFLGRMVSAWAGQRNIREWSVRFVAIAPVHATVVCTGEVTELLVVDDERCARLALSATIDGGIPILSGDAIVAIPSSTQ